MNRISRRLRAVIIGLVVAAMPVAVVATDVFTDVPDSSQFHDAINAVAGAGITAGSPSGSTTFNPSGTVNRQQMAAFLNRGLGRGAYSGNGSTAPLPNDSALASVTLTPGGVVEGTNFVKADASFTVTCTTDCNPIVVTITDGTTSSRAASFTLSTGESESASLTWVTEAPTLADITLTLTVSGGGASATAAGELSAGYVPFGPDGGNTMTPSPDLRVTHGQCRGAKATRWRDCGSKLAI